MQLPSLSPAMAAPSGTDPKAATWAERVTHEIQAAIARFDDPQAPPAKKLALAAEVREVCTLARCAMVDAIAKAPSDDLTRHWLLAEVRALRVSLGGEDASPLEQLLIDEIALAYLRVQIAEFIYSEQVREWISPQEAVTWERRLAAVHGRYLRAIETLARIRRLVKPMLQVNIAAQGGQQVVANAVK